MSEYSLPLVEMNKYSPKLKYLMMSFWECNGASWTQSLINWKQSTEPNVRAFDGFDSLLDEAFANCRNITAQKNTQAD